MYIDYTLKNPYENDFVRKVIPNKIAMIFVVISLYYQEEMVRIARIDEEFLKKKTDIAVAETDKTLRKLAVTACMLAVTALTEAETSLDEAVTLRDRTVTACESLQNQNLIELRSCLLRQNHVLLVVVSVM